MHKFNRVKLSTGSGYGKDGMMIAIYPPKQAVDKLHLNHRKAEAPHELHLTMAFLGRIGDYDRPEAEIVEHLAKALQGIKFPKLSVRIRETGTFRSTKSSDNKKPFVAHIEQTPALMNLHKEITKRIADAGYPDQSSFPEYKPHVTLAYLGKNEKMPDHNVKGLEFPVDHITIKAGDISHHIYSKPKKLSWLRINISGANISRANKKHWQRQANISGANISGAKPKTDPNQEQMTFHHWNDLTNPSQATQDKIEKIKYIRSTFDLGLSQAKQFVDQHPLLTLEDLHNGESGGYGPHQLAPLVHVWSKNNPDPLFNTYLNNSQNDPNNPKNDPYSYLDNPSSGSVSPTEEMQKGPHFEKFNDEPQTYTQPTYTIGTPEYEQQQALLDNEKVQKIQDIMQHNNMNLEQAKQYVELYYPDYGKVLQHQPAEKGFGSGYNKDWTPKEYHYTPNTPQSIQQQKDQLKQQEPSPESPKDLVPGSNFTQKEQDQLKQMALDLNEKHHEYPPSDRPYDPNWKPGQKSGISSEEENATALQEKYPYAHEYDHREITRAKHPEDYATAQARFGIQSWLGGPTIGQDLEKMHNPNPYSGQNPVWQNRDFRPYEEAVHHLLENATPTSPKLHRGVRSAFPPEEIMERINARPNFEHDIRSFSSSPEFAANWVAQKTKYNSGTPIHFHVDPGAKALQISPLAVGLSKDTGGGLSHENEWMMRGPFHVNKVEHISKEGSNPNHLPLGVHVHLSQISPSEIKNNEENPNFEIKHAPSIYGRKWLRNAIQIKMYGVPSEEYDKMSPEDKQITENKFHSGWDMENNMPPTPKRAEPKHPAGRPQEGYRPLVNPLPYSPQQMLDLKNIGKTLNSHKQRYPINWNSSHNGNGRSIGVTRPEEIRNEDIKHEQLATHALGMDGSISVRSHSPLANLQGAFGSWFIDPTVHGPFLKALHSGEEMPGEPSLFSNRQEEATALHHTVGQAPRNSPELHRGLTSGLYPDEVREALAHNPEFDESMRSFSSHPSVAKHFASRYGVGKTGEMMTGKPLNSHVYFHLPVRSQALQISPLNRTFAGENEWIAQGPYRVHHIEEENPEKPHEVHVHLQQIPQKERQPSYPQDILKTTSISEASISEASKLHWIRKAVDPDPYQYGGPMAMWFVKDQPLTDQKEYPPAHPKKHPEVDNLLKVDKTHWTQEDYENNPDAIHNGNPLAPVDHLHPTGQLCHKGFDYDYCPSYGNKTLTKENQAVTNPPKTNYSPEQIADFKQMAEDMNATQHKYPVQQRDLDESSDQNYPPGGYNDDLRDYHKSNHPNEEAAFNKKYEIDGNYPGSYGHQPPPEHINDAKRVIRDWVDDTLGVDARSMLDKMRKKNSAEPTGYKVAILHHLLRNAPANAPQLHRGIQSSLSPEEVMQKLQSNRDFDLPHSSFSSSPKVAASFAHSPANKINGGTAAWLNEKNKNLQNPPPPYKLKTGIQFHVKPGSQALQISPFAKQEGFAHENEWIGHGPYHVDRVRHDPATNTVHAYLTQHDPGEAPKNLKNFTASKWLRKAAEDSNGEYRHEPSHLDPEYMKKYPELFPPLSKGAFTPDQIENLSHMAEDMNSEQHNYPVHQKDLEQGYDVNWIPNPNFNPHASPGTPEGQVNIYNQGLHESDHPEHEKMLRNKYDRRMESPPEIHAAQEGIRNWIGSEHSNHDLLNHMRNGGDPRDFYGDDQDYEYGETGPTEALHHLLSNAPRNAPTLHRGMQSRLSPEEIIKRLNDTKDFDLRHSSFSSNPETARQFTKTKPVDQRPTGIMFHVKPNSQALQISPFAKQENFAHENEWIGHGPFHVDRIAHEEPVPTNSPLDRPVVHVYLHQHEPGNLPHLERAQSNPQIFSSKFDVGEKPHPDVVQLANDLNEERHNYGIPKNLYEPEQREYDYTWPPGHEDAETDNPVAEKHLDTKYPQITSRLSELHVTRPVDNAIMGARKWLGGMGAPPDNYDFKNLVNAAPSNSPEIHRGVLTRMPQGELERRLQTPYFNEDPKSWSSDPKYAREWVRKSEYSQGDPYIHSVVFHLPENSHALQMSPLARTQDFAHQNEWMSHGPFKIDKVQHPTDEDDAYHVHVHQVPEQEYNKYVKENGGEPKSLYRAFKRQSFRLQYPESDKDVRKLVFDQALDDYPADKAKWILKYPWVLKKIPLDDIDYTKQESWRAWHEMKKVHKFKKKLEEGEFKPIICVDTPDKSKLDIIDGHHRALAYKELDKPALCFVGKVDKSDGPWLDFHTQQSEGEWSSQQKKNSWVRTFQELGKETTQKKAERTFKRHVVY